MPSSWAERDCLYVCGQLCASVSFTSTYGIESTLQVTEMLSLLQFFTDGRKRLFSSTPCEEVGEHKGQEELWTKEG